MALPELPDDRRARPQRFSPAPGRHAVRTPPQGEPAARGNGRPVNGAAPRITGPAPHRGSVSAVPPQRARPTFDDDAPTEVHDDLRPTDVHDAVVEPDLDGGVDDGGVDDDRDRRVHDRLDDELAAGADAEPPEPTEIPGRHRRRLGASPNSRPASVYQAQAEAGRTGKVRKGRRRRENFWRELPLLIVVALLLTFLIQTFLAKVYVIPSGSMETTLHGCNGCNNDRVLVDKVTYRFTDPQPGDVVVFRGPDSWTNTEFTVAEPDNPLVRGLQQFGSLIGLAPPDEKDFVKRVIAVGGQTVQCCDTRNRVVVDGEPLDEPYIFYLPEAGRLQQETFDAVTVPDGHLWMMGDSRNNSADSRAAGPGPVPVENVIGQARLVVLPFPRFGWISATDPQPQAAGLPADTAVDSTGVPLALGLIGTLPLALARQRSRRLLFDRGTAFLPARRS